MAFVDVQDEVLSHRLGLVPIRTDPERFESKSGEFALTLSASHRLLM